MRLKIKKEYIIRNLFDVVFAALLCTIILFFSRLNEAYFLESRMYHQFEAFHNLPISIFHDLKFVFLFSVFVLLFTFLGKKNRILLLIVYTLVIFVNGILMKVFLTNFSLLGAELFLLTWDEIIFIASTETPSLSVNDIFIVFFYPLLFIVVYLNLVKRINKYTPKMLKMVLIAVYLVMIIVIGVDRKFYFPRTKEFKNYDQYILAHNKLSYFIAGINQLFVNNSACNKEHLENDISTFQKANQFNYIDTEYPLLHNTPYKNVLGSYFKEDTVKPNIVFIMVESLSKSFSGKDAHLGSFTPFLDSLATKGLYWENFLSNAERTYGVLPNTLASAPYFNSFMQNTPYIKHNSLLNELSRKGYYSLFNYGGDASFTSMNSFLAYNNINSIFDINSFDTKTFKNHKENNEGVHWGYDDESLLRQYFKNIERIPPPYISILLTLSMHSPYDMSEGFTVERAGKYLNKLTKSQQTLFKTHPEKISSIAFTDSKLKDFFKNYSNRKEFKNTIFIIYGDHNIHGLPKRNELDIYHVPLIIYSDLLIKNENFKGLCTHRDILPSLLGLLEYNYGMQFKEEKHWLGAGLDTSRTFRSKVITPLLLKSDKYVNFIYKEHVVFMDEVYKMDTLLNLKKEADTQISRKVIDLYNGYINIEKYLMASKKLYR